MWCSKEMYTQGTDTLIENNGGTISIKEIIISCQEMKPNWFCLYFTDGKNCEQIYSGYKDNNINLHIPLKNDIQGWDGAWVEMFNGGRGRLFISCFYVVKNDTRAVKRNYINIDDFIVLKSDGILIEGGDLKDA